MHHPILRNVFIAAAVCAWMPTPDAVAANLYEVTWDGSLSARFTDYGIWRDSTQTIASTWGHGMRLPSLSVDFSTDKSFTVRLEAPPGLRIDVNLPDEAQFFSMEGDLYSASPMTGPIRTAPLADITFEGLIGPEPTVGYCQGEVDVNDEMDVLFRLMPSDDFSFTAVAMTFTMPADYNVSFDEDWYWGVFRFFAADWTATMSDPGEWVTLTPEPGMLCLLALGLPAVRRRAAHAAGR